MTDANLAVEDGAAAWADAIVNAHRDLALPLSEGASDALPLPATLSNGALAEQARLAGHSAALRLGFVPVDAACVAQAWGLQTARTGQFNPAHWPDEPADFGLPEPQTQAPASKDSADAHARAFAPCPHALGLYAVLPDAQWVGRMARAGVPTVQLRFKSTDAQAIEREVRAAVAAVQGTGALLFINDHWQAAIDAGAYGVHLGQEDLSVAGQHALAAVRAAGLRLGLSTHGYAEMLRAQAHRPSYTALGAVYATTLKRMATAPQGPGRLAAYARLLRGQPLVAIGGIDWARLPEVLSSGVGSVAVVRALIAAPDPEAEVKRWMNAIGPAGLS